jgi:hypothetical protein
MNEYNISRDMYGHSFCLIMKIRIKIGNINNNNNMNILSLHSFYILYWIYYYGNLNTIN